MTVTISEGKAQKIAEVYEETGDVSDTAAKTNTKKETVEEVLGGDWEEPDVDDGGQEEDETDPDVPEVEESEESPWGPVESQQSKEATELGISDVPDFSQQSPGEFIEWFFDAYNVQVKDAFRDMLAMHSNVNDAIPDATKLEQKLLDANSGIGDDQTVAMISDIYEQAADRWRRDNLQTTAQQQNQQPRSQGSWIDSPGMGQTDTGGQDGGGWVSPGNQNAAESQPPAAQGAPPRGQGGQGSEMQMMMQMFQQTMEQQQRQMQKMMQEMNQSQQQDGGHGSEAMSELQQLVQMQEMVEELSDDDDQLQELAQILGQEIGEVKEMVNSGGSPAADSTTDPTMVVMSSLAQRDDVNPETLATLAQTMGGASDPEVRKKKLEVEADLQKSENRKEMLGEAIDGLGENVGELLGSTIKALNTAEGGQQNQQQPQQQAARQPRQAQPAPQQQQAQQQPQPAQQAGGEVQQAERVEREPDGEAQTRQEEAHDQQWSPAQRRIQEATEQSESGTQEGEYVEQEPQTEDDQVRQAAEADGGEGLPVHPDEAADLYPTDEYPSFISMCSDDHGMDPCVELWNAMNGGGE